MADDDHTSRPPTKRVRSDNDHSKGETKAREDDIQESKGGDREDGGDKGKHEDEEWLSKPPFSVGASKDGWKTKWRSSCWCGKSASRLGRGRDKVTGANRSCVRLRRRPQAGEVLSL